MIFLSMKFFKCPYSNCDKFYGSEVSLNLHMKLKHNGGNKTDRERLAVNINKYSNFNQNFIFLENDY